MVEEDLRLTRQKMGLQTTASFWFKRKAFGKKYVQIIAEIGVNHDGSLEKARDLIVLAKKQAQMPLSFRPMTQTL